MSTRNLPFPSSDDTKVINSGSKSELRTSEQENRVKTQIFDLNFLKSRIKNASGLYNSHEIIYMLNDAKAIVELLEALKANKSFCLEGIENNSQINHLQYDFQASSC